MAALTPVRSIRKYCVECSGGSVYEVARCEMDDCPLYPYRMGKNPNRKHGGPAPKSAFKKKNAGAVDNVGADAKSVHPTKRTSLV